MVYLWEHNARVQQFRATKVKLKKLLDAGACLECYVDIHVEAKPEHSARRYSDAIQRPAWPLSCAGAAAPADVCAVEVQYRAPP